MGSCDIGCRLNDDTGRISAKAITALGVSTKFTDGSVGGIGERSYSLVESMAKIINTDCHYALCKNNKTVLWR